MQNATLDTPERRCATLEEAADFLKVSPRTLQLWQAQGLLRTVHFGRLRRFLWAEIKQLEKSGVE
jgi:excisionase family DNA binding protein